MNTYTEYIDMVNNITSKNAQTAEECASIVRDSVNGQITGLDYGILTSNIWSYMIYDSMNESKIKKQTQKAIEQYEKRSTAIYNKMQSRTSKEINEYEKQVFFPTFKCAITEIISNLIAQYLNIQSAQGKIDLEALKSIDEKRSNDILENLSVVEEKAGVLLTSLNLCPYNLNAYVQAVKYYLFDDGLATGISFFDLKEAFKKELLEQSEYNANENSNIADIYKEYHEVFRAIALTSKETESNVFKKQITQWYQMKKNRLVQILSFCNNINSDDMVQFFLENHIGLEHFEEDITQLLSDILTKAEFFVLRDYANIDLVVELNQIDSRYCFHSYEDIDKFILQKFSVYKSSFITYFEKKEKEKQLQVEREQQEIVHIENKKKWIKRIIGALVVFMLFAVSMPDIYKDYQYRHYIKMYGLPLAGIDKYTTPNKLFELLGEPGKKEWIGGKRIRYIYENINTFGTKCTITVTYSKSSDDQWPNEVSRPDSCSVDFQENDTVTKWYVYDFDLKFGKSITVGSDGERYWKASGISVYTSLDSDNIRTFGWMHY